MENYKIKDKIIEVLSNNIIDDNIVNNPIELLKEKDDSLKNLGHKRLSIALESLISDNLITKLLEVEEGIIKIKVTDTFFSILDSNRGWYATKFFKEEINLELLAAQLDKLTAELDKIENTKTDSFSKNVTNIAAISQIISHTSELLLKFKSN